MENSSEGGHGYHVSDLARGNTGFLPAADGASYGVVDSDNIRYNVVYNVKPKRGHDMAACRLSVTMVTAELPYSSSRCC